MARTPKPKTEGTAAASSSSKSDPRIAVPMPETRRARLAEVVAFLNSKGGPGRVSEITFSEWAIDAAIARTEADMPMPAPAAQDFAS